MKLNFNYGVKGIDEKCSMELDVTDDDFEMIKKNILVKKNHLLVKKNVVTLNYYYDIKALKEERKEIKKYISQKDTEHRNKKNLPLWKRWIKPNISENKVDDLNHVINLLNFKKQNFLFTKTLTSNQVKQLVICCSSF